MTTPAESAQSQPGRSFPDGEAVLDFFADGGDRSGLNQYVLMQAPRYAHLLQLLESDTPFRQLSAPRIADVGPGLQTELIAAANPSAKITTVGYDDHQQRRYDDHIEFDLNAAYDKTVWPQVAPEQQYDIVVFCEVIEHLYTTPIAVLGWLRTIVKPGGHLVIQTPNAQAITRRIRAVLGKPLYGRITNFGEPGMNPGHFREYTPAELREMGERTGFEVVRLDLANYIRHTGTKGKLRMLAYDAMPTSLRQGATVIYKAI